MLSVIYVEYHKQAHYAECHYAECRYAECRYAECRYVECRNQVLYAECRYAECHGALILMEILNFDLINGRISSRMTKHFFTAVFTNIFTLVTAGDVELTELIPQILD